MKIGEYDIKLSRMGWLTLAAAAVANAVKPGTGFRKGGEPEMAYRINVYIVDPKDERIYVKHEFYGENKADAERVKTQHLEGCENFQDAVDEGRIDEEGEEISADEWPEVVEDDEEEK